jgi:P4 family phage/plasmid primase-like protien
MKSSPTHTSVNNKPSKKLFDYLQSNYYKSESGDKEKTNTRIADKTLGISGGTYHIADYDAFLKLYYEEIIKKNKTEFLTEKQLENGGPIAIDIDFRYDSVVENRQHKKTHIIDALCLYLAELKTMYQWEEGVHVPIFVFEKPDVNRVNNDGKQVTKDGIHIIIGLQSDHTVQMILRKRILAKINEIWGDLPIINQWDDVFDEGISNGCTNWQLHGSCKPTYDVYRLVYVFDASIDPTDNEITMPELQPQEYLDDSEKFRQLSVRYRQHPSFFMTNTFIAEYQTQKTGNTSSSSNTNTAMMQPPLRTRTSRETTSVTTVLNIRNKEELDAAIEYFLESLSPADYELHEAYEYTMALPKSYYGPGSFTKWIRTGWALKNISPQLFIVWVAFSAQSENFSYSNIRTDLWDRWASFNNNMNNGLTKRSIMYWVRQDNAEGFTKVMQSSIEYYIDLTLEQCTAFANSHSNERRGAKGSGDYDIATVLYQLFRDDYRCVSIKANVWYRFANHRWEEIDSGTTLRKAISDELRDVYSHKLGKMMRQRMLLKNQENTEGGADKLKALQMRLDTITEILQRLSKTNDKKNIMVEAKELFFDPLFLQKLDNNPYLLCFKNGIVDLKQKVFRKGTPEDYVSKCTNINYRHIDPLVERKTIEEIEDFMRKLFPNPELHRYMWDFLSSTLIGNNLNQTFNMFIGIGSNGKSILINLMEQVLGDYKGDVPLTLLTQQRTKIGGLAPELVQLKGVRLAVMQEPSKGDRINEGIMKQITGGDPIQARAPYMPQIISYIPQFKLCVCTNEFMELRSQDHGTRRRIRVVDFESLFTDNPVQGDPDKPYQYKLDKTLKDKFEYWREIFAFMLVEHAFKTEGHVQDCQKVMASSNSYLDRQDFISEFITERIEVSENGCIPKNILTQDFKDWFSLNFGGKPPNARDVADVMDKKFGKISCGVWRGVKFKTRDSVHGSNYDDDGSIRTRSIPDGEQEFAEIEEI